MTTLGKLILAGSAITLAAAAPEMTAAQFLAGMTKAEQMGPAALLSSDVRSLRGESDRVLKLYRADIARQAKSSAAKHSCPPPEGKGKLNGDELKAHLTGLSAAQKAGPFRVALYDFMKKKYPCK